VLSLILFLATVGLWVRSYYVMDRCGRLTGGTLLVLQSNRGRINVDYWEELDFGPTADMPWTHRIEATHALTGSMFSVERTNRTAPGLWLRFPHWLPALLFAVAPAYWLLGPYRRQSKRQKLGLCLNCGYDLRASPARCPECGSAAATMHAGRWDAVLASRG
jgi:hypothetical protein